MKRKIDEPYFEYDLSEGNIEAAIGEHRIEGKIYQGQECREDLYDISFFGCQFDNVVFTGKVRGCQFADCRFAHCDFSNIHMNESVMRRVILKTCRFMGTDMSRSLFQDTQWLSSQCSYINFSDSRFTSCRMKDSVFAEASFSMCKFKDTELSASDFTKGEFLNTSLKGLDFSDSKIEGFLINPESLRGCTMNYDQAVACALLLGIKVK